MELRIYRDWLKFAFSLLFVWVYFAHILIYFVSKNKERIRQDLIQLESRLSIRLYPIWSLIFFLHNNIYFRSIFYHRIGIFPSLLIGWWRPGCKYFLISKTTKIEGGLLFAHPYSTILNAESIGSNFSFRHLTTLGSKESNSNRPTIGSNVTLGAAVTIVGKVTIGDNVTVGAGSVVTKSVPDDCTVVGNPAQIIRRNGLSIREKL